ncbi:hypothetical protein [Akkermansia massiliensis]|uniref:hypothetical protein n=1 Tax=Akkermansia massiliensis TaxID=2927224 RepID=UPI00203088C6|nr:hypothetical protein [Akkermansia sp. B2-R-115]MCM0686126.1 hypothetical protein [Akkermansia sp. B2-R-115]
MQIKNIIALIILASLPNVSCQSIREAEEINVYHCKGVVDPGISSYYYFYQINGNAINVKKMIPDIYAHSSKDKLEFDVKENSNEFISKLNDLINNVKSSKVDFQQRKEITVNMPGKSFIYYAKSDEAGQYIDAVVDVVLNMYKDKSRITVNKRD